MACLAAPHDRATRDASEPTSATQHVFDYEHPRPVDSQFASRPAFASRCLGDVAFHDAAIRFGGSWGKLRGGLVSPQVANNLPTCLTTEPLAPLSPPRFVPMALSHASIVIRAAKAAFTARP